MKKKIYVVGHTSAVGNEIIYSMEIQNEFEIVCVGRRSIKDFQYLHWQMGDVAPADITNAVDERIAILYCSIKWPLDQDDVKYNLHCSEIFLKSLPPNADIIYVSSIVAKIPATASTPYSILKVSEESVFASYGARILRLGILDFNRPVGFERQMLEIGRKVPIIGLPNLNVYPLITKTADLIEYFLKYDQCGMLTECGNISGSLGDFIKRKFEANCVHAIVVNVPVFPFRVLLNLADMFKFKSQIIERMRGLIAYSKINT